MLFPAICLAAGAACVGPLLDSAEQEIVNGLPSSGHPSVARVLLTSDTSPGALACTGVLITHSSVLTAAHCVEAGSSYYVDFGSNGFWGTATLHPTVDMAVVSTLDKLGRPFHARLATQVNPGAAITLVGYGRTNAALPPDGIKRYGFNTIDSVDPTYLYFDTDLMSPPGQEAATCFGDSGGPAFLGGFSSNCVGGVTKGQYAAAGTACTAAGEQWFHTRVDQHLAWLEAVTRDSIVTCAGGGKLGEPDRR